MMSNHEKDNKPSGQPEKITILTEDLNRIEADEKRAAQKARLRVDYSDLEAVEDRAGTAPPGGPGDRDETERGKGLTDALWCRLLVSFIPLANIAFWFRMGQKKRMAAGTAYGLSLVSLVFSICVIAGSIVWFFVLGNWVHQALDQAERSVVQVVAPGGVGTGVVISGKDGEKLILTSRHIFGPMVTAGHTVSQAELDEWRPVMVHSKAGVNVEARLAALPKEPGLDLALLLVKSDDLEPMGPIGSFNEVRPGQKVIAIGYPADRKFTVTRGNILAKWFDLLLQIDAVVRPYQSGGPLIDSKGRLIGVMCTIDPQSKMFTPETSGRNIAIRADLIKDADAWELYNDSEKLMGQTAMKGYQPLCFRSLIRSRGQWGRTDG